MAQASRRSGEAKHPNQYAAQLRIGYCANEYTVEIDLVH
jgi:hypothetical protein